MMPEPHRILFFVDTLGAGGAERQTVELVTRLDRARFAPQVICLHAGRSGYSLHFAPDLARAGVPLQTLDLRWTPFDALAGLARIIPAVWRSRPAVLHAVNHHANHLARLARLALPPSLKLITAVRTDYHARQLFYERVEQWAADRVVCNSPHVEQKLRARSRIPARKLICIPNGLDCDRFGHNPDPGLRERLAPGAGRVIAMLGRITRQKSPHLLAQAVGWLHRRGEWSAAHRVLIVGEPESAEIQAGLDAAVRQDALDAVVRQLPLTDQPEALYHAADFTVLASLWEGLPNAVLESLAAGRPVVVSEAANAAGIIEEGQTGWVVRTNDVADLARRLGEILRLPADRLEAMRPACRARAADFSMARMVGRYQDLYRELVGNTEPAG